MRRRLALWGLAGVTAGSLAMAAGNAVRAGAGAAAVPLVIAVAVGAVLVNALRDDEMLDFEDPAMSRAVVRWAPVSMAVLGTLLLLIGLTVLAYAVT